MTDLTTSSTNKVYIANNDSALIAGVTKAVCVLTPGSLAIAGFNSKNELIVIDQYDNDSGKWNNDFLENKFQNKSLENLLRSCTATFITNDKSLVVPKALYNESEAVKWMNQFDLITKDEVIYTHPLKDKAYYLFTIPADVRELLIKYLPKAKVLPLAAYQFHKQAKADAFVACCIAKELAYFTVYKNNNLQLHKIFSYQNAEDIAYAISLACKEAGFDANSATLEFAITDKDLQNVVVQLTQYFPDLYWGLDNADWTSNIYLMQLLNTCA